MQSSKHKFYYVWNMFKVRHQQITDAYPYVIIIKLLDRILNIQWEQK
jgi:hypothetical protein